MANEITLTTRLLDTNVNAHTEKKNGLTYLSWAWAWAEVLKADPHADWAIVRHNGLPYVGLPDTTAMVEVMVTIRDLTRVCLLPVMNHKNQAIKNPDAFAINTAIMRCLVKAIALHGLGLYIYAGEDLPASEEAPQASALTDVPVGYPEWFANFATAAAKGTDALRESFKAADETYRIYLTTQDKVRFDALIAQAKEVSA